MKLMALLNELATKCEKQNESSVIDILSRSDLQNITLADEVAHALSNNLVTLESAKNSLSLKRHFTALALGAVDAEINNMIKMLELGNSFEKELSLIPNTYEKQRKLTVRLKEILDNLKKKHEDQLIDLTIKVKLLTFDYINVNIPRELNVLLAKAILDKELNGKAVIVRENKELKLKRADNPAIDYTGELNEPLSFDAFLHQLMSSNNLLAASGKTIKKKEHE